MGGLIPAHAGKTGSMGVDLSVRRAHPRSRGENVLEEIGGDVERGSSPLTRGKRRLMMACRAIFGLIPAHAGKTRRKPRGHEGTEAHPRSRGENGN